MMFSFRYTTLYFFILLFSLNILMIAGAKFPWFLYLILLFVYLFISVFLSFFICSGFHMKVPCHGARNIRSVSLTFDDGPDPVRTPLILDILAEEKVKATFFCKGKNLDGNEEIVRRIVREGHRIGGHSYFHSDWFDFYPARKMIAELSLTDEKIFSITGLRPRLFRPPYGVINPMVKKAVAAMKYEVIGFSNRLWDTTSRPPEKLLARFRKQLRPGDIILLHDTGRHTSGILKKIILHARSDGYSIIPLDEMLNLSVNDAS